jgi:hypothetical protein
MGSTMTLIPLTTLRYKKSVLSTVPMSILRASLIMLEETLKCILMMRIQLAMALLASMEMGISMQEALEMVKLILVQGAQDVRVAMLRLKRVK